MKEASIISIIKGGLGNQLFTYAAGRALALRHGRKFYVDSRLGYINDSYGRKYLLDRFPIKAGVLPESWRIAPTLKHPKHKLIRAFSKYIPLDERSYISQKWDTDGEELLRLCPKRRRVTINGYWSNEKLFLSAASEIRCELSPPVPSGVENQELGQKLFESGRSVFVHVRRVRYQTRLTSDYYNRAIRRIMDKVEAPEFYVFGDDIEWVLEHIDFQGAPCTPVRENERDEIADLWLMTCCRHSIVANSSFSWWAAWLGRHPLEERVVIAPFNRNWGLDPADGWTSIGFEM